MKTLFVLMGKTYSYKKDIIEFCSWSNVFNCTDKDNIVDGINIMEGSLDDVLELRRTEGYENVFTVFVDTPSPTILERGLAACSSGDDTYIALCSRFLSESDIKQDNIPEHISAVVVDDQDSVDACTSFVNYVKDIMKGR